MYVRYKNKNNSINELTRKYPDNTQNISDQQTTSVLNKQKIIIKIIDGIKYCGNTKAITV